MMTFNQMLSPKSNMIQDGLFVKLVGIYLVNLLKKHPIHLKLLNVQNAFIMLQQHQHKYE